MSCPENLTDARRKVKQDLKEAISDEKSRNEVLDTLEKFPGAYEALMEFVQDCNAVIDGEYDEWEYALDMCAPEVDEDGVLSFEIPYSRYVWDPKGQTWRDTSDDSDDDEEDDDEVPDSDG